MLTRRIYCQSLPCDLNLFCELTPGGCQCGSCLCRVSGIAEIVCGNYRRMPPGTGKVSEEKPTKDQPPPFIYPLLLFLLALSPHFLLGWHLWSGTSLGIWETPMEQNRQKRDEDQYPSMKMAQVQHTDDTEGWGGCGATGTLIHSRWEFKMVSYFWRQFGSFL